MSDEGEGLIPEGEDTEIPLVDLQPVTIDQLPPLVDLLGTKDTIFIEGYEEENAVTVDDALTSSIYKLLTNGQDNLLPHGITLPTALLTCDNGVRVRALFDQGAQTSLIRRNLADVLKLIPIGTERLILSGINHTKPAET